MLRRVLAAALALALSACADQSTVTELDRSEASAESRLDATEYQVVDLGQFDGLPTQAFDVDKHGAVYGVYGTGASGRSFRWTDKNGYEDLGTFEGNVFRFLTANDHGLLNGSVIAGTTQRAVAFVPRTGFVYLDGENPGSTLGNNDRGAVAGTRFATGGNRSFGWVWTQETGAQPVPLSIDGEIIASGASDVNERGAVAGGLTYRPTPSSQVQTGGYLWDAEQGTRIIPPLADGAPVGVTDVSEDGIVIGASYTRRQLPGEPFVNALSPNPGPVPVHAWKWSETMGLVDLGTLGGDHSVAWDVDKDGNVYGWASDAAGVQHAVKWPATGGIIALGTLGGSSLLGGLNKHGVLAGWSTTASGETHAIVMRPTK